MNGKKLYRSNRDKMFLGVCGGLGEYFDVDPTLIRLGVALVLMVSCGTGLLTYILATNIIPHAVLL